MDDIIISDNEPNVVITTSEPEVIITDEYQTDYNLPIASPTTLGGVKIGSNVDIASDGTISVKTASTTDAGVIKVGSGLTISDGVLSATGTSITIDNTLSTTSVNPVQNKVITSNLNTLAGSITSLQGTVSNQGTTIGNHTTAIGNLNTALDTAQGDIDNLEDTVSSQGLTIANNTYNIGVNTNNILTNTGNITSLTNRVGTAEGNITSLTNGFNELSGNVDTLLVTIDTTVNYLDIANIWTAGSIAIRGKGKIAFVELSLEGSLTIAGNTNEVIYTISSDALKPKYLAHGAIVADAGILDCQIATTGNIRLFNLSSSSITLTKLKGSVPIVLN